LYLPHLDKTCDEFQIDTRLRLAHFLAQLGHESGQLRYVQEIASGEDYEGRLDLGNTLPLDGVRYKGRGLIQITGRNNYALASLGLDLPLLDKPELLEQPEHAARSAGWFWNNGMLNALADLDDLIKITKRVNGGLNGLANREMLLNRAKEVL
jgi:putative chitinase